MTWPSRIPQAALIFALVAAAIHLTLVLIGIQGAISPLAAGVALFGFGYTIVSAVRRFLRKTYPRWLTTADVALAVFVSVALFAVISAALALAFLLRAVYISLIIDGTTAAAGLYAIIGFRGRAPGAPLNAPRSSLLAHLVVLIGSAGLFVAWHQGTPYPSNAGWDFMTFVIQVEHMQLYGGFAYIFIPPYPASGGIPYPGMFMDLLGGLTSYLGVSPFDLFWWGTFPMILGFAGVTYGLVHHYSRNPLLAVAVAFIGVFIGAAQGEVVRNVVYLTVDMTTQVLFLLAILWFLETDARSRNRSVVVFLMAAFLGAFYFYALLPTFPLLLSMVLGSRRVRWLGSPLRIFLLANCVLLAGVAFISFAPVSILGSLAQFVPPSDFPLDHKIGLLASIYSPLFLLPLLAGSVVYLFHLRDVSREPLSITYFAVGAIFLLAAYFMPAWITYRFEFYMRSYVLVFLAAIVLGPIPLHLFWTRKPSPAEDGASLPVSKPPSAAKWTTVAVVVVAVLPAVGLYPLFWDYAHGYTAWYSADEYAMGRWIQQNLPADAYVATDPGTGYYIRALAYRNSSVYFILPDGRAPLVGLDLYADLNLKLFTAFRDIANISQAWTEFRSTGFADMYVLISSRTPVWLEGNGQQWLSNPTDPADTAYWVQFFQSPYFTLVHQVGGIYLFAVTA